MRFSPEMVLLAQIKHRSLIEQAGWMTDDEMRSVLEASQMENAAEALRGRGTVTPEELSEIESKLR